MGRKKFWDGRVCAWKALLCPSTPSFRNKGSKDKTPRKNPRNRTCQNSLSRAGCTFVCGTDPCKQVPWTPRQRIIPERQGSDGGKSCADGQMDAVLHDVAVQGRGRTSILRVLGAREIFLFHRRDVELHEGRIRCGPGPVRLTVFGSLLGFQLSPISLAQYPAFAPRPGADIHFISSSSPRHGFIILNRNGIKNYQKPLVLNHTEVSVDGSWVYVYGVDMSAFRTSAAAPPQTPTKGNPRQVKPKQDASSDPAPAADAPRTRVALFCHSVNNIAGAEAAKALADSLIR